MIGNQTCVMNCEGLPMVAYHAYYIGKRVNLNTYSAGWSTNTLRTEIDQLINIRRSYVSGTNIYLSTQNTNDLFVMIRCGNETKPGCILVLNDNDSNTLSDTAVNTGWTSTTLIDVLDTNHTVNTDANGIASLSAPSRSYRIYVRQGDL